MVVKSISAFLALVFAMPSLCVAGQVRESVVTIPTPPPSYAKSVEKLAEGGELSHLVFTATDEVASHLISPEPNGSGSVATPFILSTGSGAGVELAINGVVVPVSRLGKREIVIATGETRYTFYGVGLVAGPNEVVVTGLGSDKRRFSLSRYIVYGRGPAVSFKATTRGLLTADGLTYGSLRIQTVDRWNHPAMSGFGVKVAVLSGDVRVGGGSVTGTTPALADVHGFKTSGSVTSGSPQQLIPEVLATSSPGGFSPQGAHTELGTSAQASFDGLTDENGEINVPILPGLRSGVSVLRISSGDDAVTLDTRVSVSAYVRRVIITGLITGGIGAVPGDPGTNATALHEANSRRGRISLFSTGKIAKNASATVAYDTSGVLDENRTSGSFVENPDSRPYLVYGDSSSRRADALSSNHLFARVNSGRSSLMYGEFQAQSADDAPGALGGFNLLLNGAHLDYATDGARLEAFRASSGVSYARDIFTPSGLATTSGNLHPGIIVGSDSVSLIAIDRQHGYVISQSTLLRNIDYVLDYGTGSLRFINPPLAYDASFNPQQILVQYEYAGVGGSTVSGGRVSAYLGKVRVGLGYANDSAGNGNVSIFGQNISAPLPGGLLRFEHLSTSGILGEQIPYVGGQVASAGMSGNAIRLSALGGLGLARYDMVFQKTSAGFNNPFGGISSPGLTTFRVGLSHPISGGDVSLLLDSEQNQLGLGRSARNDVTLRAHRKMGSRVKMTVALSRRSTSSNGALSSVGFLSAGQVANPTNIAPILTPVVNTTAGTSAVTQAEVGASYAVSPAVDISFDRTANLGASANSSLAQPAETTAQVSVLLGKAGRAYVRELITDHPTQSFATSTAALTSVSSSTRLLQLGVERQIGSATTLDTQYSIQNSGSGSDVYSAIGVKERLFATKVLRGDVLVQKASSSGGNAVGFMQYGTTFAYDRGQNFKSTASYQFRTGGNPGSTLALGAVGYLGGGLSFIGSVSDAHAMGVSTSDERVGISFRPNDNDRSALLFGYQHINGSGSVLGEKTNVLSLDALDRVTPSFETTLRVAYKLDGDSFYSAHSGLIGFRAIKRFGPRLDLGGELRASGVSGVPGSSVSGYAVESGYRIGDGLRVGAGYNFQQTPDLSLAAPPRRKGFFITVTSVVDSLFGYGRQGR